MAMLDQIAQQRQRLSQRLIRVDAERTKLSGQLDELEIAERALTRFGGKVVANGKPKKGRPARTAVTAARRWLSWTIPSRLTSRRAKEQGHSDPMRPALRHLAPDVRLLSGVLRPLGPAIARG